MGGRAGLQQGKARQNEGKEWGKAGGREKRKAINDKDWERWLEPVAHSCGRDLNRGGFLSFDTNLSPHFCTCP